MLCEESYFRSVTLTLVIFATTLLSSCRSGSGSGNGGGNDDSPPEPFLVKPFDLAPPIPIGNIFDHDIPRHLNFTDSNGYVVGYDGIQRNQGEPGASLDGHDGYDWGMPVGTPLLAAAAGRIFFAGDWPPAPCPILPGTPTVSSKSILIEHTDSNGNLYLSSYGHLSSIAVSENDNVSEGQFLGYSGNTGCSNGPHLHFSVYRKVSQEWLPVDPFGWNGAGADPWAEHPKGLESVYLWKSGQAPTNVPP
jgi:murein DD-endopeptidase MepM/ murein hydrolase activator NlpD